MNILKALKESICAILQSSSIVFRLIEVVSDSSDNTFKVRYHCIGKRISTIEPLNDVVKALLHIQGFSNQDSHIILDAYQHQRVLFPLLIESVIFNEDEPILLVKDIESNEQMHIKISTIHQNMSLISQFNDCDSQTIMMIIFNKLLQMERDKIKSCSDKETKRNVVNIR